MPLAIVYHICTICIFISWTIINSSEYQHWNSDFRTRENRWGIWLFLILLQSEGYFETFNASEFKSAITSLVIYDVNFWLLRRLDGQQNTHNFRYELLSNKLLFSNDTPLYFSLTIWVLCYISVQSSSSNRDQQSLKMATTIQPP